MTLIGTKQKHRKISDIQIGDIIGNSKIIEFVKVKELKYEYNGKIKYPKYYYYKVECLLCKSIRETDVYSIIKNPTISCGCIKKETSKENSKKLIKFNEQRYVNSSYEESCYKKLFRSYKQRYKNRNLQFTLAYEDFKNLILKDCFYCGNPPSNKIILKGKYLNDSINNQLVYNGLDRIDSSRGYELDNVKSCCITCNTMKLDLSEEAFKKHIVQLYKHYILNQC